MRYFYALSFIFTMTTFAQTKPDFIKLNGYLENGQKESFWVSPKTLKEAYEKTLIQGDVDLDSFPISEALNEKNIYLTPRTTVFSARRNGEIQEYYDSLTGSFVLHTLESFPICQIYSGRDFRPNDTLKLVHAKQRSGVESFVIDLRFKVNSGDKNIIVGGKCIFQPYQAKKVGGHRVLNIMNFGKLRRLLEKGFILQFK